MSLATRAKSAKARAAIAARIIKRTKRDFGRNMDDCFEMGDGDEVVALLKARAHTDMTLLYAMAFTHENQAGHWAEEIMAELGLTRAEVYGLRDEKNEGGKGCTKAGYG